MIYLDVDTALAEVPVNAIPLIDDTDFKTIETSVAYNAAGMALNWHFVTTAGVETTTAVTPTTGGTYDWAHAGQGMYTIKIPASGGASINNDTEGYGYFTGYATGVLPWRSETYCFRAAALNNALIDGGDLLDVNTTEVGGTSQTARDLGATLGAAGAGLTGVPWNAAWDAEVQSEVDDALQALGFTATVSGRIDTLVSSRAAASDLVNAQNDLDTLTGADGVTLATLQANYAPSKAGDAMALTSGERTTLAAAIWNALTSGMSTAGSIGKKLADWVVGTIDTYTGNTKQTGDVGVAGAGLTALGDTRLANLDATVSSRLASASYTAPPSAASNADAVWDEALSGHLGVGSTGEALNAAGAAGDPWTTALPGAYGAGSAGKIIGDNVNATISSRSSHSAADVWASGTRTLSSFGSLVSDIATAVWGAATRILTAATNITSTGGTTVPQTGDSFDRLGLPAGASVSADLAAVKADAGSLLSNLAALAGKFTGITLLAHWLGAMAGKQSANATALTEIRASGAGSGTFDPTTDSNEALRDTAPMGTAMRGTDSAMLASSYTAPDNVSAAAAASASAAVKVVTDKLGTTIELDGVVYRFTTNALEMSPAGGGGGGGATMATAVPTTPDAGSMGEALAASLHWRLGKRVLVDNGDGTYTLKTYRAHALTYEPATLWHEEVLNHPTQPSEVTPA